MQLNKMTQYFIIGISLSLIPSCVMPKADTSLTSQTYINEQTNDRMEFTKKTTVILTWSSDQGFRNNGTLLGYEKDHPYEFNYTVFDRGHQFQVIYLTSSQAGLFPYSKMEISDSKNEIIAIRQNGNKEIFRKMLRK